MLSANPPLLEESRTAKYKADPKPSSELARRNAESAKTAFDELGNLRFTNERLGRYASDYRAITRDTQRSAVELAVAFDALVSPTERAAAAEEAWRAAGDGVRAACRPQIEICTTIQQMMLPGTGDRALSDEYEAYAAKLEALNVEDAKLKEAVAARANAARAAAAAQRIVGTEQAKVDAIAGRYYQSLTQAEP